MATNKPPTRTTHIIRIFGTNADGDILSDIWADVERIDQAKTVLWGEVGTTYQGYQRRLKWCDDPNGANYEPNGNPARTEVIIKVCDPTSDDFDNPEEWIPIRSIKQMKSVNSYNNYEGEQDRHLNSELNQSRVFEARRIVHYDTNIDEDAQLAAENGQSVYVVSSDFYEKDTETRDEDQYIEHEIVKSIRSLGNAVKPSTPPNHPGQMDSGNQGRQTALLNNYLIDESEPAKQEEMGTAGINPPYRLDLYQNIININMGSLAVEFFEE